VVAFSALVPDEMAAFGALIHFKPLQQTKQLGIYKVVKKGIATSK